MEEMSIDQNPIYAEVSSIGDLLIRASAQRPDRDAIIFPDRRLTYFQVTAGAIKVARGLAALAIQPGQHVGLFMTNSPEYVESFFGITLLGCIVVPLNIRHRGLELSYIISNANLTAIVTSGHDTSYVDLPALLAHALNSDAELQTAGPFSVAIPSAPQLRYLIDRGGKSRPGFISIAAFEEQASQVPVEQIEQARRRVRVRDPALILYTSGTTAHPKGCVLSHEAVTRGPVERARHRLSAPGGDVTWAAGPLFHIGSLAPFIGSVGVSGTFLTDTYFEAGRAIALMKRESVTSAWPWFPAILQGIIDHPDFDAAALATLQHLFLIAPETLVDRVQALLPHAEIMQACGMTETGGVFALSDRDESARSRATTQGKASPGVEIRIVDPDTGIDCESGNPGEIWVRGYCVMNEYYNAPDLTRAALTSDGWLKTGDLYGRADDGSLTFRGRLKDMIKVGGENVATMEVEAFLCSHPDVKLAEVVGRPDAKLDEVPVAFVEVRESSKLTAEELIAYCNGRIASYKVPRAIHFLLPAEWPMSATKVDKRALRERLTRR
jgi:fatty-acyl-CoA synthase/long-chain acyl-CoA synthetase